MSDQYDRNLVIQMRTFAQNPSTQPLLVGDQKMLTSLYGYLSSADAETIKIALEAFNTLAANTDYRETLHQLQGFLVKLAQLCDYDDDAAFQQSIQTLAQSTINRISNAHAVERVVVPHAQKVRSNAFSSSSYRQSVTLSIPNMKTDADRLLVEKTVLETTGALAVNINMYNHTVNMFTSNKTDFLPKVTEKLRAIGFPPVDEDAAAAAAKDAAVATEKKGYMKNPNQAARGDALVRYNANKSSKKTATPADQQNGWLGGLTSYFW